VSQHKPKRFDIRRNHASTQLVGSSVNLSGNTLHRHLAQNEYHGGKDERIAAELNPWLGILGLESACVQIWFSIIEDSFLFSQVPDKSIPD
jgi:hypothetical protein